MQKGSLILLLGFLGISFMSCEKEEEPMNTVDSELVSYFNSFQEEAALRGVIVDYEENPVEGNFSDFEGNIAGQCAYYSEGPPVVSIDNEYWSRSDTYEREFVVFHELGHCFLGRPHLNTTNTNGTCVSMMNSGESGCVNAYGRLTRAQYLDELFGNN
ncbi:MAG: hypothetical protein AAF388_00290 [Bacteroidota bacterium]